MICSVRDYIVASDRIKSILKELPDQKSKQDKYLIRIKTKGLKSAFFAETLLTFNAAGFNNHNTFKK
jgi:hypothetical protein